MVRMGAIMAAGILDAGGRNATLGLQSRTGPYRRTAVVGLALFLQYWYWHPLAYSLSLALQPTAIIGVDASLRAPADFKVGLVVAVLGLERRGGSMLCGPMPGQRGWDTASCMLHAQMGDGFGEEPRCPPQNILVYDRQRQAANLLHSRAHGGWHSPSNTSTHPSMHLPSRRCHR